MSRGYAWSLAGLACCWAVLLALAAPAWADSQVLRLSWPSREDPNTVVTEIELTETQIIITIRVHNRGSRTSNPRIHPPGDPLSFFIQEKNTGRRPYLAGSQGLAVHPNYASLSRGRSITFKLFFNRIPLASFNLLEGEPSLRGTMGPGFIFWDFLNIDLAKLEKNFKSADRPPPRPDHIWNQPAAPPAKPEAKPEAKAEAKADPPAARKPAPETEPLKFIDNPPAKKDKDKTEP